MPEISGESRIASLVNRHLIVRLRDALALLPEPWIVLASRRASGADGPPWVRYIALHRGKGIALVDVDQSEPAIAPLEDFLSHIGFAALQTGALPIVAVTIAADDGGVIADRIDASFAGSQCHITNPNWCEAVVDLLLSMPELMLTRLRRAAETPAALAPSLPVGDRLFDSAAGSIGAATRSTPLDEPWPSAEQAAPRQPTWRSWPMSPVTIAVALLALGAVGLVSREASPPRREAARSAPVAAVASAPSPTKIEPKMAMIAPATQPAPRATADAVPPPVSSGPQAEPAANVGPPVPGCLPIRFFGFIGMR